jgi:predicted neuraminidase
MGKSAAFAVVFLFTVISSAVFYASETEEPFFRSEPIFTFTDKHPENHASTIAEMPNGDFLSTWFGGSHEGMPDVAIWSARMKKGSAEWSDPVKIIDDPEHAEGNSVLFTGDDGKVLLFYVVKFDQRWDAWEASKIYERTSDDNGYSWSEPRVLADKTGWMIRNNIVRLPGGRFLLPTYTEISRESLGWISGDGFRTWEEFKVPVTEPANSQPAMAYLGGTRLIMAARHWGIPGNIWMSFSDDLGKTWLAPRKTRFKNPDSGINMIALKSGALILAYNDNAWVRTPLCVSMSEDGGRTWPYKKSLEKASAEFSYPFLIQSADGHIHLTYTSDGRKFIKHAEFNEEWLKTK